MSRDKKFAFLQALRRALGISIVVFGAVHLANPSLASANTPPQIENSDPRDVSANVEASNTPPVVTAKIAPKLRWLFSSSANFLQKTASGGRAGGRLFLSRAVQKPLRNIAILTAFGLAAQEVVMTPQKSTIIRSIAASMEQRIGPTVNDQIDSLRPAPIFSTSGQFLRTKSEKAKDAKSSLPALPQVPRDKLSRLQNRAFQHLDTTRQRYRNWSAKNVPKSSKPSVPAKAKRSVRGR